MKIQVTEKDTREEIIAQQEKEGNQLLEEQNHSDGHFLIFGTPEETETLDEKIERKIKEIVKPTAIVEKGS